MKSYTDIFQSKKLAEILPIESADMCYRIVAYNPDDTHVYQPYCFVGTLESDVPCWSLAALLDVLPNNKHISTTLSRGGWKIEPTEYVDNWWCEYEDEIYTKNFSISADNPVDACVEMIIHLNELKML